MTNSQTNTYQPQYPLNRYVDTIWVGKSKSMNVRSSHHAPMFTELIFNFGDQFQVSGQNIENFVNKENHQIISGLKTEPFHTRISGAYQNVGLILKPFCYGTLLNKFGTPSLNTISDILREYLYEPAIPQFDVIEPYLLELFEDVQLDSDIQKFEKLISSQFLQKGALRHFNQSLSITQKGFIQKFKKHYVLTPGQYVKLRQVNYAIYLLQNYDSGKMGEIGLEAGFFDQSHFIRVFKKFCGSTPKQTRIWRCTTSQVNSVQF